MRVHFDVARIDHQPLVIGVRHQFSVEQGTQIWIAGLLLAAAAFHLLKK